MKFKNYIFLFAIAIFGSSCEDIIEVKLSDENLNLYAVEARITSDSNPFVFLYKSQLVNTDTEFAGISGATVVISGNPKPGKTITLQESAEIKGLYLPKPGHYYVGEPGNEYTLTITVNGIKITSTELLAPVEPIDSIQVRASNRGSYRFLGIFTYGKEAPKLGNYYKWDVYINKKLLYPSDYMAIASDEFVNGNYIPGLEIFTDFHDPNKPEDRILNLGDTIHVRQNSISKFAYNFYYQMINQGQTGGMFSVPPANIKSNLTASDESVVLGMFTAHDVSRSNTIIIDESIEKQLKK